MKIRTDQILNIVANVSALAAVIGFCAVETLSPWQAVGAWVFLIGLIVAIVAGWMVKRLRTLHAVKRPAAQIDDYRSVEPRIPPKATLHSRLHCLIRGHRFADYGGTMFTPGHIIRCSMCGGRESEWTKKIRADYATSVGGPDRARELAERSYEWRTL